MYTQFTTDMILIVYNVSAMKRFQVTFNGSHTFINANILKHVSTIEIVYTQNDG